MLINNRVEEPYSRLPPEGPLPILSKSLVKNKLTQKFFKLTKNIYESNSIPPKEELSNINNKKILENNNNHNIKNPTENFKFNIYNRNSNLKIKIIISVLPQLIIIISITILSIILII